MIVQKFGGTSLGSKEYFEIAMKIISSGSERKIIVVSALSGVTDMLCKVFEFRKSDQFDQSFDTLEKIRNRFADFGNSVFSMPKDLYTIQSKINMYFNTLYKLIRKEPSKRIFRKVLSYGEIISSEIVYLYLSISGVHCFLVNSTDFMRIDREREPDYYYINENLNQILNKNKDTRIFITQGFICKNFIGEIDNLGRGGSDKSATVIGKALQTKRVEIWSDKDGMLNNDPGCVETTYPLDRISYEEAEELASFGAKILHPTCIKPAKEGQIQVVLKNTIHPHLKGTLISSETTKDSIKAVAAKDKVTVIKITASDMLLAYGFLSKIFQIFEQYKTPVDMIATSEVTVTVSIDETKHLNEIIYSLNIIGKTEIFQNQTIIAVVGNIPPEDKGITSMVFGSLKEIPIRMISYGAGSRSITVLINSEDKIKALNLLNDQIFVTNEHSKNRKDRSQINSGLLV